MRITPWKAAVVVAGTVLATSGLAVTRHGATAAAEETRPFADGFDRADGPVGNGWTALRGGWAIRNGAVVASGVTERLLSHAQPLGATFSVSASLTLSASPTTDRSWTGIATNIVRIGDTQSYYALRVGQRSLDGGSALWQLVRIDRSAPADDSSLLASGAVVAQPGDRVVVGLTSEQSSTALGVRVDVPSRSSVVTRSVVLRQIDRLAGGFAGLYSQNGSVPVDDFSSVTTTRPADVSFVDSFGRAGTEVGNGWTAQRGTWILNAGGVAATGTDTERVLHPAGVTLGSTFTVGATLTLPSPAPVNRAWAGVAFNVKDGGNYYALRVGLKADDSGLAQWQVVRLTNSVASLLKGGTVRAPAGSRLRLTVTSRNLGTGVQVGVTGGAVPVDDYVAYAAGTALSGGRGGLYSGQGVATLDDFALTTTTAPAAPPPSSFAPLDCAPTAPSDYDGIPGGNRTVDPVVSTVGTTWAGHPVDQSILTAGDDQYVAYYDAERRMTVAKRTLPATTWTYQPLGTVLGWDSHNYVTMALDAAGHLHVAGNMHVNNLRYFRTTVAGDISTLEPATPMVDAARETEVTYPRFLRDADDTLIFSYRQGSSGQGVTYYNRYDVATRTWAPLLSTPLTDGEGLRSAYEDGPTLGPDGYWHLTLMWRDTTDAGSSSMPSYMRSLDLVHWEDSVGAPIALPARYSTADVVDPVPIFGGAVNGLIRTGFDAAGQLVVVYSKYDENLVNQFYAARPDGAGGWRSTKLTAWTGHWNIGGGGTLAFPIQLGGVSALPDGNLRVDYSCRGSRRTLVVDPREFRLIADVATPTLPAQITAVRSGFPGMGVKVASSPTGAGTYVLRWESLGPNNDQPRDPADTPAPQPLEVYLVRSG